MRPAMPFMRPPLTAPAGAPAAPGMPAMPPVAGMPRPSAPATFAASRPASPPPPPAPAAPSVRSPAPSAPRFPTPPLSAPRVATAAPVRNTPPIPSSGVGGATPPARPPINPFLANDPNAKAKRLARALVSDIVAYFPGKREEGVRDGTLKQLFREEIKKSYEEYVEQIGREFADSTTHFQDALNDVLAGGKKLF
jgi:hypothetical protein